MKLPLVVALGLIATACAAKTETQYTGAQPAAAFENVMVLSGPAPWPYRLGSEVYAPESPNRQVVFANLASAGAKQGCDAVVMARMPAKVSHEGGVKDKPWGICAYRVTDE